MSSQPYTSAVTRLYEQLQYAYLKHSWKFPPVACNETKLLKNAKHIAACYKIMIEVSSA